MNERVKESIRRATRALRDAEKPVRILRRIQWHPDIRERFFASGETELPKVDYALLDARPVLEHVSSARKLFDGSPMVRLWLNGIADVVESGARMLACLGTAEFTRHSRDLYGGPDLPLVDGMSTPLKLAERLAETFSHITEDDLGSPKREHHQAADLATYLQKKVTAMFGDVGPIVEVVTELGANVIAGSRRVRVRDGVSFSSRDFSQLVNHEIYVHVATKLNGKAQDDLPILAAAHPGTTRTQEGLAVFAEFISGSLDPDRFKRLAERVLAIHMASEGADFIEVYRFFVDRGVGREQAFENSRRVFRGGLITGGAPFTKDSVYLDGLVRVHNFLRAVVANHRTDCLQLLFCGKIDIEDVPALCELAAAGLCRDPRYLPPWAGDRRFLVAYLAYSGFLNQIELGPVSEHYAALMANAPIVDD